MFGPRPRETHAASTSAIRSSIDASYASPQAVYKSFVFDLRSGSIIHPVVLDYLTTAQHPHITASHIYSTSLKPDCNETSRASAIRSCSTHLMLYLRKRIGTTRKASQHRWRNYIYCLRSLFVLAAAGSVTE